MTQVHVEPPLIPLIKGAYNDKSDKHIIKTKLRRDPTSSMPYFYEYIMSLFDNGNPEEFFLYVHNFKMNLVASGTLNVDAKIH